MVMALATAAFLAFGGLLVLVGSAQAGLAAEFDASLEQLGLLAATISLGLGAGIVSSGPCVDRWPRRPIFVATSVLAALSLGVAAEARSFAVVAWALGLAGFGAGAYETVLNAVVSEPVRGTAGHAPRFRPDQRLVFVHLGATVGAVLAPLAISRLIAAGGVAAAFRGLALAFALLAVWGAWVPLARPRRGPPAASGGPAARTQRLFPGVWPFVVAGLAYVGFETAFTAFAPTLASAPDLGTDRGVGSISAFWAGLLLGRVGFLAWPRPPGTGWLVGAGMAALAVSGIGVGLGLPHELVFALIGLGFGPTFPVLMALAGDRFGTRRGTAMGLVAGAGAAGGAVVPWVAGRLGDDFGPMAIALVLAGCCVLLAMGGMGAKPRSTREAPLPGSHGS